MLIGGGEEKWRAKGRGEVLRRKVDRGGWSLMCKVVFRSTRKEKILERDVGAGKIMRRQWGGGRRL